MKLSRRIATILPMLFFALPASGHDAGAAHGHGVGSLLLLTGLAVGIAAMLRR